MPTKTYPASVSRTLNPDDRGLVTIVGRHDHRLSDADLNLVQDLQDLKRQKILNNTTFSGCLTRSPFIMTPELPLKFEIPAFNFLFAGEVLRVGGNDSESLTTNYVTIPGPEPWSKLSTDPEARIYVVYLEMWYRNLNPETGDGFLIDPADPLKIQKFYWNGCVNCRSSHGIVSDLIDPFQNIFTTGRAQLQWALRVASVPLSYDFDKYRAGLDPGGTSAEEVYGRGSWDRPVSDMTTKYRFSPMGKINGDFGLWRAGDGNPYNGLGTLDGYSYAAPVGLVFQRNTGVFSLEENPLGSAERGYEASGLRTHRRSGRWDGKFADVIYAEDVVDTRMSVSLTGYELAPLMERGLVDLYMGDTSLKVARGESPASVSLRKAMGSKLSYYVAVSDKLVNNADTLPGEFDGFANGFSSDSRTFYSTHKFTVDDKIVGTKGGPWVKGDALQVKLGPASPPKGKAYLTFCLIQAYTTNINEDVPIKEPLVLYGTVIKVNGIDTHELTLNFTEHPEDAGMDLKVDDLYVTVGVKYEAGSRFDLKRVPYTIDGGVLYDSHINQNFPVYGVNEYDINTPQPSWIPDVKISSFNPNYSVSNFGTRVVIPVASETGKELQDQQGGITTTFIINRNGLANKFTGIMVNEVFETESNKKVSLKQQIVKDEFIVVVLNGSIPAETPLSFVLTCINTAQVSYVPAVKGITAIEEVVLIGANTDTDFILDSRVKVLGAATKEDGHTYLYVAADQATLKGVAATDDGIRKIWMYDSAQKHYVAQDCFVEAFGGILTVKLNSVQLNVMTQRFFMVASVLPALASPSTLQLGFTYIPYQGEGVEGREYSVLYSAPTATVTTNGTGQAPVVGIKDTYPFNRCLPLSTILPSLDTWQDNTLINNPMAGEFDGNYFAKRYSNTEHTFEVKLHNNDFIEPLHGYKRKKVKFITRSGGRGFSRALPHVGFAIKKLTERQSLGESLQTTIAPVALYVNNRSGSDTNNGITKVTPLRTIKGALSILPPVLRHPVSIILIYTGVPYNLAGMSKASFTQVLVGDGETRSSKYYCLGNVAFTLQDQAKFTIGRESTSNERVEILCPPDYLGFGDGKVSAFYVGESRVIFNGLKFTGFKDFAVKATDSDVEFLDCEFVGNRQSVAADQGSMITFNKGILNVPGLGVGVALDSCSARFVETHLVSDPTKRPDVFILAERNSNVTISKHDSLKHETGIDGGTLIVKASANSTVVCEPSWNSKGKAKLTANSVMFRTVDAIKPAFSVDNIMVDNTSSVVSAL